MSQTPNMMNLMVNKNEIIYPDRASVQNLSSQRLSVGEINASPISLRNLSNLQEIEITSGRENQRLLQLNANKNEDLSITNKIKLLPKIKNPRAEDRLKALIGLLGKKNPDIPQEQPFLESEFKDTHNISIERKKKVRIHLPQLCSVDAKPLEQKDINDMKNFFIKSPIKKAIFKIDEKSSEEKPDLKIMHRHLEPLPLQTQETPESDSNKRMNKRKRIIIKNNSHNTSKENVSPVNSEGGQNKKTSISHQKQRIRVKRHVKLPFPDMNFDHRVHQVSIDEALERLNQLTNQSENARKDLLKIQENALAIKIGYEKYHKIIQKANLKKEMRNT